MKQVVILRARPRNLAYIGLAVNLLQSTLALEANIPPEPKQFTELPSPRLKRPIEQIENRSLISEQETPIGKQYFVHSLPKLASIIISSESSPADDANLPVNPIEWRNPLFENNPATRNKFWTNNNLQDTLTPVTTFPFIPTVQFGLFERNKTRMSWEWKSVPENQIPNGQTNQLNPLTGHANLVSWIQNRPQYYIDLQPNNQYNWPNPAPARLIAKSFTFSKQVTPIDETNLTFSQLYINPLPKKRPIQDWVKQSAFVQLETIKPDGLQTYNNPVIRIKPIPQDWFNNKPQYYVEPGTTIPISQNDWPIFRRPRRLIIRVNTRFPEPINTAKPFNETMQWPNPVLRVKRAIPWSDHYVLDDNQPPIVQFLTLPLPNRKKFDPTWIFNQNVSTGEPGNPTKVFDWPNPIIIKRPTLSEINSLLQLPFEIPPGEKPFFEEKWPNPLIAKKILHSGWIWDKRFYYVEEPLQPNQYDWPIFRPVKRNPVGYIYSQKQESEPNFFTISDVPRKKIYPTLTHIDSPTYILKFVEYIKPFNQNVWPLTLKVRTFKDLITWLGQNPQILPNIVGRIICLYIQETEYLLEIQEQEYDLEFRATDYDLDMGGNDCE